MIFETMCNKLKTTVLRIKEYSKLTAVQKDAVASIRVDMEHVDAFRYRFETTEAPIGKFVTYYMSFDNMDDRIVIYVNANGAVGFKVLKDVNRTGVNAVDPTAKHGQNYTKSTYLSPLFQADKDLGTNMLCK